MKIATKPMSSNPRSPKLSAPRVPSSRSMIRMGFVPLVDCAPLVVAKEMGLFKARGLNIELEREPGWATVRDKIVMGTELEASHALAGQPFAASYGLGTVRRHCVTGLVMNAHGNAVTISSRLWHEGVRDAAGLVRYLQTREEAGEPRPCFGVVHPCSSHNFILRNWLRRVGLKVGRDVEIVIMPPEMMERNLEKGNLVGFCVGEPWNSSAILNGVGWRLFSSAELCATHPEKVIMVTQNFAETRSEEHFELLAALLDACRHCDEAEHRKEIAALLARPEYLNVPEHVISNSLLGSFQCGFGLVAETRDFHLFSRDSVNRPSLEKANWVLGQMRLCGLLDDAVIRTAHCPIAEIFREDIYEEAVSRMGVEDSLQLCG